MKGINRRKTKYAGRKQGVWINKLLTKSPFNEPLLKFNKYATARLYFSTAAAAWNWTKDFLALESLPQHLEITQNPGTQFDSTATWLSANKKKNHSEKPDCMMSLFLLIIFTDNFGLMYDFVLISGIKSIWWDHLEVRQHEVAFYKKQS